MQRHARYIVRENIAMGAALLASLAAASWALAAERNPTRLSQGVLPAIAEWMWHDREFQPDGYRPFLDMVAKYSNYNLLTTTLRAPGKEVADKGVHDQIREAVLYAHRHGIKIAMDLDVRAARAAFQKAHPDEMQEMLRLREIALPAAGEAVLRIPSENLDDHYTLRTTPYLAMTGRLVRVYSYIRGPEGIEPASLLDITHSLCTTKAASAKEVTIAVACGPQTKGRRACAIAAFTHFVADVFSPHLIEFQRAILAQYADVSLDGACKDEWGFPPCYDGCPAKNDYWYSRFFEAAYAQRTGGRELIRDALLMTFGERGRQPERQAAINHFMELCLQRNAAIEDDFYRATKSVFGPSAVVATHPTWWPYPGAREFKKNGLDWWMVRRDLAQVDEVTPFCVRTALAKKWGSPVWYNMFYATKVEDYERSLWTHALGGGRINYHPVFPMPGPTGWSHEALLQGGLTRGECRIRLLNFIATAPIDCPVAVVFGHPCAMNWAGPAYDDVGIQLTNRLWQAGFYADLIPSSEIANGSLKVDGDGTIHYGAQRYAAVALYHPEFERQGTAAFFQQAAGGHTALFRVGPWTEDFEGRAFDGKAALPPTMAEEEPAICAERVIAHLREQGIVPQEPAVDTIGWDWPALKDPRTAAPPPKGRCHLLDGTQIVLAGADDVTGDPIRTTLSTGGHEATFDCRGVAAVRLAKDGSLSAMAAGGLKHFRAGSLEIILDKPLDVALWRDGQGKLHGVLQGSADPVPTALAAITADWLRLAVPPPLPRPATKQGRAGQIVEWKALCRQGSEFLYYVFDWGDGSVSATAHGAPKCEAMTEHRFDRAGKYEATWTAVTMSGRRIAGQKTTFEITGTAPPPTPLAAVRNLADPPTDTKLRTASQNNPFHTAWVGQVYDRLYRFDELLLTPTADRAFPEYFAVEYSMDGGRIWQEIPSASYVHFPDPQGKRLHVLLHGVTADALRIVSHRLPRTPQGYGLALAAMEAFGSKRLLFQCDGAPKYNAALNNLWLVFGSAENEAHQYFSPWWPSDRPDASGMMGIGSTLWSYWNSLKISWIDTKYKSYFEDMLNGYPLDEEGRIGTTVGQFLHLGHSRHYACQSIFISGVVHYFLSHRDPALLQRKDKSSGLSLLDKLHKVMQYQLRQMQGATGLLVVTDPDNDGTIHGKSDNYWDAWRFGYKSAYENVLFYDSLLKMALLENYLAEGDEAARYRDLAAKVRQQFNRTFWDDAKGRYIGAIDRLGNRHDYGFTFVNLEAIAYGLVPDDRAERIFAWLDGQRVVPGDTSTGADIYHFTIAPRANTLAAEAVQPSWWDNWTMEVGKDKPGEYGTQIQNGGAIFYVSYFDLMARLKALGIARAMQRLDAIVAEFGKDQLRSQPGNRFGIMGTLGTVREFPESGLVPLFYLHGILGIRPDVDGLIIEPHLPADWSFAEVAEYRYAGQTYHIRIDRNATEMKTIETHNGPVELLVPLGSAHILKVSNDGTRTLTRYNP